MKASQNFGHITALLCVLSVSFFAACGNESGGAGADAAGGNDAAGTLTDTSAADASPSDGQQADVSAADAAEADAPIADTTKKPDAGKSDAGKSDASGAAGCATLSEAACKATKACFAVLGSDPCKPTSDGMTIYAGCMPSGGGCGAALTCGEKAGKHVLFPSTCQPAGWTNKGLDTSQCCQTAADPKAWSTCKKHGDCAVFEAGCCDHCNGGNLVSVNKSYLSKAKTKHKKTNCQSTACTEMGCGKAIAVCDAGVCVGKADPAFGKGCASLKQADCSASPSCGPLFAHETGAVCANKPSKTKTFAGCMSSSKGCGDALTCASKDGKLSVFMSTCLGEGYKAEPWKTCCKQGG